MTPRIGFVFSTGLKYTILIALCLVVMAPVATAVLGSIRTTGEFMTTPFGLPQSGVQWANYLNILLSSDFWNAMKNSVVITSTTTVMNVVLASLLAFVFTRITF